MLKDAVLGKTKKKRQAPHEPLTYEKMATKVAKHTVDSTRLQSHSSSSTSIAQVSVSSPVVHQLQKLIQVQHQLP